VRVPQHVVDARRRDLASLIQTTGWLPIAEVCARLKVSEATARRDLDALEQSDVITRTRGGALGEFNQRFPSFRERQRVAAPAKRRIARAAAALIAPGSTVFLDAGSTVYAVAEALIARAPIGADSARPLTVVTNSLPVAELLADTDGITVSLLGGRYLRRLSIVLGPESVRHCADWSFDLVVLGAEGADAAGVTNSQPDVVAVQRAAVANARAHALCLDASKLGQRAPEPLFAWHQVQRLVTDADAARLDDAGIRILPSRLITA